ncbi:hypothetical protein ABFS82_14G225500 [Erythranthe guttata]|nr:PREDICTED: transcription factor GAMYB-like [Erythranthe guttata]XP_012838470.1 PREDICTED: transcription factor GAMYB-like [Erythranthe guttata]XP_012838471.1 PREDICTED: transcription factor GAMYB-like [Erythranthe guttata]XP_012838472.1 PREDICTED: transcription factor GAMYB-like [Erythranthe guttata]|eukprot:XP_012838469.1 PREDICTED: transcription factor GAMYB-like [Erythranthe guttata]
MSMTSESDERMIPINGADSPSTDDANSGGDGGLNGPLKKGPWTSAEDAILVQYVNKNGEGNWNAVQKHSGLARCGKSCRLRWANHLRPDLKKGAFTAEEERRIIELHAKMGNKWARMAAELPGRTDNEIKNYWNTRIKRRQRAGLPIYPPDICLQALNEGSQQNEDTINTFSPNDVHRPDFIQISTLDVPSLEFKGLEINQPLYPLDIPSNTLLDISTNTLLSQGLHPHPHPHNHPFYLHPPSKRLRSGAPESMFPCINIVPPIGMSQYQSNDGLLLSCPSSDPSAWAMKMELPSLQTQMRNTTANTNWGGPPPSPANNPFFEPADVLMQSPPPNEGAQLCNLSPQNSGLLNEVLYESGALNNSKTSYSFPQPDSYIDIDSSNANVLCDAEWEPYGERLSPLVHSLDDPHSDETKQPVKDEDDYLNPMQYNDKFETNPTIFSKPDFMYPSTSFDGPVKQHPMNDNYLLKDVIGTFLGDDFRDCKKMDTGATSSSQGHCHDSCAWNVMRTI